MLDRRGGRAPPAALTVAQDQQQYKLHLGSQGFVDGWRRGRQMMEHFLETARDKANANAGNAFNSGYEAGRQEVKQEFQQLQAEHQQALMRQMAILDALHPHNATQSEEPPPPPPPEPASELLREEEAYDESTVDQLLADAEAVTAPDKDAAEKDRDPMYMPASSDEGAEGSSLEQQIAQRENELEKLKHDLVSAADSESPSSVVFLREDADAEVSTTSTDGPLDSLEDDPMPQDAGTLEDPPTEDARDSEHPGPDLASAMLDDDGANGGVDGSEGTADSGDEDEDEDHGGPHAPIIVHTGSDLVENVDAYTSGWALRRQSLVDEAAKLQRLAQARTQLNTAKRVAVSRRRRELLAQRKQRSASEADARNSVPAMPATHNVLLDQAAQAFHEGWTKAIADFELEASEAESRQLLLQAEDIARNHSEHSQNARAKTVLELESRQAEEIMSQKWHQEQEHRQHLEDLKEAAFQQQLAARQQIKELSRVAAAELEGQIRAAHAKEKCLEDEEKAAREAELAALESHIRTTAFDEYEKKKQVERDMLNVPPQELQKMKEQIIEKKMRETQREQNMLQMSLNAALRARGSPPGSRPLERQAKLMAKLNAQATAYANMDQGRHELMAKIMSEMTAVAKHRQAMLDQLREQAECAHRTAAERLRQFREQVTNATIARVEAMRVARQQMIDLEDQRQRNLTAHRDKLEDQRKCLQQQREADLRKQNELREEQRRADQRARDDALLQMKRLRAAAFLNESEQRLKALDEEVAQRQQQQEQDECARRQQLDREDEERQRAVRKANEDRTAAYRELLAGLQAAATQAAQAEANLAAVRRQQDAAAEAEQAAAEAAAAEEVDDDLEDVDLDAVDVDLDAVDVEEGKEKCPEGMEEVVDAELGEGAEGAQ